MGLAILSALLRGAMDRGLPAALLYVLPFCLAAGIAGSAFHGIISAVIAQETSVALSSTCYALGGRMARLLGRGECIIYGKITSYEDLEYMVDEMRRR